MSTESNQFKKTFTWRLDAPLDQLWAVLGDTARFNEANGFPKHTIAALPQPDGSSRFIATAKKGPLRVRWDDIPQNFVSLRWYRHERRFHGTPFVCLIAECRFTPEDGKKTRCEYSIELAPRNLFGRLLVAAGAFRVIHGKLDRLMRQAESFCNKESTKAFSYPAPHISGHGRSRTRAIAGELESGPYGHGLTSRLCEFVLTEPDVDVQAIRPLALAHRWDCPERHLVELCLDAVIKGLLTMHWQILCPRCRVGKNPVDSLRDLPKGAHCATCNIDFSREFSTNVELIFQPGSSIRPVQEGEFCLMGPISTPHIVAQITIGAGQQTTLDPVITPGAYRFRTLEPGSESTIEYRRGMGQPVLNLADDGAVSISFNQGLKGLLFRNNTGSAKTLIAEELKWRSDALTADRAITLQAFRDLFDEDTLRPGDDVEIKSLTMMFTDLKGSTALYEKIGDPQAFALVREHFEILTSAVRGCNGSIVKLIGDAIMAVFLDPADGFRCALRIHHDIQRFNQYSGKSSILVKIGLHTGRCISVTISDRLDYYGTAVNLAARLQGCSEGGDVVLSESMAGDPGVIEVMANRQPQRKSAVMRGYSDNLPYFRITPSQVNSINQATIHAIST